MQLQNDLNPKTLSEVIQFIHVSDLDGRETKGKIVSKEYVDIIFASQESKSRRLEEENPYEFYVVLSLAMETQMEFTLRFRNP